MNSSNPAPDQPTGMNELREILVQLSAYNGDEYHKLHSGKQSYDLTNGRMSYYEDEALKSIQQIVERCIGPDEPTTQSLLDDGPPYIDNPVAVRRNELRAELRHNLQQAGLLRGNET